MTDRAWSQREKFLPCRELNAGGNDFTQRSWWDNSSPLQSGQQWCGNLPRKASESHWDSGKSTRRQEMRYFQCVGGLHATMVQVTVASSGTDLTVMKSLSLLDDLYRDEQFDSSWNCSFISDVNLWKPTGHVLHQQFNIQQLYVLPTLYLCVL